MTVARVTQVAVEVLASYTPKSVVTQATFEVLADYPATLRSTSQITQVLQAADPLLRSTLQVVQVLYPNQVIEALTADITATATVAADLIYTTELLAAIIASGDVTAPLQYQAVLTGVITASGDLVADLIYEASLTANITADGDLAAPLQYTAGLTADITASATVTANIAEWTYLTAGILVNGDIAFAKLTLTDDDQFDTNITADATVTSNLSIPRFTLDVLGTGTVQASITGTRQFIAAISGTASVTAELDVLVELTATITASGDVTVELRENTEYLDAAIVATGDITVADLDVPWHPGNTLNLTQEATAEIVLLHTVENILDLQHELILIFGKRFLSASSIISFTHSATVIRVLPTETASSTITFNHSLSEYREATSYLTLTQSAVGVITFIECVASSVLNLTDLVVAAGSIFNLPAESQLNLTQLTSAEAERSLPSTSSLNLWQNAFAVTLSGKRYILLQAPFEFIQTSVILPNPLLDDNESLVSNLTLRRSMDNTPRTYVQTSSSRRLRYTFTLNRLKALELEAFFNSYNGANIKMLNWKGEIWNVKLITNPIDFVQTRRAEPGGDRTDVNVEFEGALLNG